MSKPITDITLSPWEWLKEFLQFLWDCFPGKREGAARDGMVIDMPCGWTLNASVIDGDNE